MSYILISTTQRLNVCPRTWPSRGMNERLFRRENQAFEGALRLVLGYVSRLFQRYEFVGVQQEALDALAAKLDAMIQNEALVLVNGLLGRVKAIFDNGQHLPVVAEAAFLDNL